MKGDRVEVLVDAGSGTVRRFQVEATRAGRRVEIASGRGLIEVTEVTRGGTAVRSGRFMASRVIAIVEHPVLATAALADEVVPDEAVGEEPVAKDGLAKDVVAKKEGPDRGAKVESAR